MSQGHAWVVEHLGGNRARWAADCGHEWEEELLPAKRARTVAEEGFQIMARWWRKEAGGAVGVDCPQCLKGAK